jgi:hypothetical protein
MVPKPSGAVPSRRSSVRSLARTCAALACAGGGLLAASGPARAAGTFGWAPVDSPVVARGREVAARFDQESLFEISVEVNNAFALDNRRAIAVAEEELRRIPGVRRVFGPAQLADLAVDGRGRVSVRRVLERGGSEGDDEAVRQRVVRRADALGWFLAPDGGRVRFLIDVDPNLVARGALRVPVERAIASSGLQLLYASGVRAAGDALWPEPSDAASRWGAAVVAGAGVLLALALGRWLPRLRASGRRRYPPGRRPLVIAGAAIGAAALLILCAVAPVRGVAWRASAAAVLAAVLGVVGDRPAAVDGLARRLAPRPHALAIALAVVLVVAAVWLAPQARIGTQQWHRTPFLFVSVRGDFERPAVLREVRRLADFLRAQPGVDSAWSAADLFFGIALGGGDVSRVPESAGAIGVLLDQARGDPAVALELAPDHREGLVVVRFDDDPPADRLAIYDRLEQYVRTELRSALIEVDVADPHLPRATRLLGKGVLAGDARERILRICARSGRPLNAGEMASVERITRQAAVLPAADLDKLKLEIAAVVRDFAQGNPASGAIALTAAERTHLSDEIGTASVDASIDELRRTLRAHLGAQLGEDRVTELAAAMQPRLAFVRQRAAARINFRAMLYGADLPTDGMLADEVRSATREAMGSVVGIPVAPEMPGALRLDAVPVGGAANDHALSEFLRPALRWGALAASIVLAVLLVWAGRGRGLLWWPVALAPAALAVIVPAVWGEPVGLQYLALLVGLFAAGVAGTIAMAARREI